jgi:hypothetical protein
VRPQRSLLRCAGPPSSNRALLGLGLVSLFSACGGKEAELADADDADDEAPVCAPYDPSPPLPGCLVTGSEDDQSDGRRLTRSRALYDAVGQLSSFDEQSSEDPDDWVLCGYAWRPDGAPELEWCVGRALYTYTWAYDGDGEPTGKSYDAGSDGVLDKQWRYETDGLGHITFEEEDADLDGQGDSSVTRVWEGELPVLEEWDYGGDGVADFRRSWTVEAGRVIEERTDADADGVTDESITYTYDALGNLTVEAEDADADGTPDLSTTRVYADCLLESAESIDADHNITRWTWLHDSEGRPVEERTDWDIDGNADQLSTWAYSCPGDPA